MLKVLLLVSIISLASAKLILPESIITPYLRQILEPQQSRVARNFDEPEESGFAYAARVISEKLPPVIEVMPQFLNDAINRVTNDEELISGVKDQIVRIVEKIMEDEESAAAAVEAVLGLILELGLLPNDKPENLPDKMPEDQSDNFELRAPIDYAMESVDDLEVLLMNSTEVWKSR